MLHSDRFADTAPAEVWAMLLDEGIYLGSVSTYYRVLREAGESRERRAQATPSSTRRALKSARTSGPSELRRNSACRRRIDLGSAGRAAMFACSSPIPS